MLAIIIKYPQMPQEGQMLIKQFFSLEDDNERIERNKELIFKL
jgi:hypothetical protein